MPVKGKQNNYLLALSDSDLLLNFVSFLPR